MAQIQKQLRKAAEPRTKMIKLTSFNPVMKPGFEIAAFTTLPNMWGITHGVVTTQRKQISS